MKNTTKEINNITGNTSSIGKPLLFIAGLLLALPLITAILLICLKAF
ncbi:hypothetical protein [Algibacter aquimarinus]